MDIMKNSDATLIKSAGAVVAHPFGSLKRSIIVSVYEQDPETGKLEVIDSGY